MITVLCSSYVMGPSGGFCSPSLIDVGSGGKSMMSGRSSQPVWSHIFSTSLSGSGSTLRDTWSSLTSLALLILSLSGSPRGLLKSPLAFLCAAIKLLGIFTLSCLTALSLSEELSELRLRGISTRFAPGSKSDSLSREPISSSDVSRGDRLVSFCLQFLLGVLRPDRGFGVASWGVAPVLPLADDNLALDFCMNNSMVESVITFVGEGELSNCVVGGVCCLVLSLFVLLLLELVGSPTMVGWDNSDAREAKILSCLPSLRLADPAPLDLGVSVASCACVLVLDFAAVPLLLSRPWAVFDGGIAFVCP